MRSKNGRKSNKRKAAIVFDDVIDNFDEISESNASTPELWVDRYAPISVVKKS
jgi:hypothetical protein